MSVLFGECMTVYNYRRDEETGAESWHRSVVKGVQWRHNRREVSVSDNIQSEERVESITIDFSRSYQNGIYVDSVQYRKAEEPDGIWTLTQGKDILVLGKCETEVKEPDDIRELEKQFHYVVTVKSVSDNRNMPRLKHIKVKAK